MSDYQARLDNKNIPICVANGKIGDNYTVKEFAAAILQPGQVMGVARAVIGVASVVTGTGDGTVTEYALSAIGAPALVGTYTLTCIETITNGGRFELKDPNGLIVDSNILIAAGAGGVIVYEGVGMTFKITDGTTDFVAGDFFTLTITAGEKLVPVTDAAVDDGSELPLLVLAQTVDATSGDVAGISAWKAGDFDSQSLLFKGTASLDSIVTSGGVQKSNREWLRDTMIIAIASTYPDGYENS
jgi:hypothetical protein